MKITDMNLICLEECFEYLELRDLLNVADANKSLCKAAEFVFHQKYSQRCVGFSFCECSNSKNLVYIYKSRISLVDNLKSSFQIIRCFGHLIKNVEFTWGNKCKAEQPVFDCINKYCADSLVKIFIHAQKHYSNVQNVIFTKSFTQVEEAKIYNCNLDVRGEEFGILFPKVKKLKHYGRKKNDISALVYHYPDLEELSIDMTKHTKSILKLNPQLKNLQLEGCKKYSCDENKFRNSIEPMQNLEELTLSGRVAKFSKIIDKKIKLKNVKQFTIRYRKGNKQKYPFLFEKLERLRIHLDFTGSTITPNVYDFIEQHPSINKLSFITMRNENPNIDYCRIRKALPLLMKTDLKRLL